jgi:hypothetical protein
MVSECVPDERGVAALQSVEELAQNAEFEAFERGVQRGRIIGDRRVDAGRVLGIESRHDLEHDCRILRGSGKHSGLIQARGESDHPVARNPSVRGFDARHTREGGGLADRSARIGPRRKRRQPGGGSRG